MVYPLHLCVKYVTFEPGFCDNGAYSTYGSLLTFAKTAETGVLLPVLFEVLLAQRPVVPKPLSVCEQLQSELPLCAAASQLSGPL